MTENTNSKFEEVSTVSNEYANGDLTFNDALAEIEKIMGWEANPFTREKIRRSVESLPADIKGLMLSSNVYEHLMEENGNKIKAHRAHIEANDLANIETEKTINKLKAVQEFVDYVLSNSTDLASTLVPLAESFSNEEVLKVKEITKNLKAEAEKSKNLIKADSFEGVSEFTPDTVEELLGDTENK